VWGPCQTGEDSSPHLLSALLLSWSSSELLRLLSSSHICASKDWQSSYGSACRVTWVKCCNTYDSCHTKAMKELRHLFLGSFEQPVKSWLAKLGPTGAKFLSCQSLYCRLEASSGNITLHWMGPPLTNTLAYSKQYLKTVEKSFITFSPGVSDHVDNQS